MTLPLTLNNPSRIAPLVAAAALAALIVLAVLAGHVIDDGSTASNPTAATTATENRDADRGGGESPWLFVVVAGMLALGTALAALQVATGASIDEDLLPPQ